MNRLILLITFFPVYASAQSMDHHSNTFPKPNVFLQMIDKMMKKMHAVPMTESADIDFLTMMIPHHEGAIEMADYEIKHGSSQQIIQLAKSIKAEQQVQIKQMEGYLVQQKGFAKTGMAHKTINDQSMTIMMKNLPSLDISASIDKSFVWVMIPHHQAAIEMAKGQLQYGIIGGPKRLAEMIISEEQIEIDQMKKYP